MVIGTPTPEQVATTDNNQSTDGNGNECDCGSTVHPSRDPDRESNRLCRSPYGRLLGGKDTGHHADH